MPATIASTSRRRAGSCRSGGVGRARATRCGFATDRSDPAISCQESRYRRAARPRARARSRTARARAAAPPPSAPRRRPRWRSPSFSMKFACTGEMRAPPIAKPFSPQASSSWPLVRSPGGFLNTEPNVRAFRGCAAVRRSCMPRIVARIVRRSAGVRREHGAGHDLVRSRCRAAVAQAELLRPAARVPRGRDDHRLVAARSRISRAVGAGVHAHRAADRARDRAAELDARQAGVARPPHDRRQRRAAAAAHQRRLDRDLARSPSSRSTRPS